MELLMIILIIFFLKLIKIHNYLLLLLNYFILLIMMSKINYLNWFDINMFIGMNNYNYGLIMLSLLIMNLILMNLKCKIKFMLVLIMFIFMILNFYSMNLLLYYFFYESSLIFIFYLIMNYSHSMFKLLASYMLMFYTLLFSLPMLLIIVYMYNNFNSLMFIMLDNGINLSNFMFIYLMLGFLVKIPMYMLHSWLLKAHVEAPYYGSMILASIMLKLGSYGLLRLMMMMNNYFKFKYMFMMISIIGIIILSILCIQQIDMKLLIAISSIVHMGLMITSMYINNKMGFIGSYLMMIAHGLCSSGLFYLVNEIYKNTNTRLMILNKGVISISPLITMFWFMFSISNASAPLSLNLFSEIMLLSNMLLFWKYFILFLILYCFFSFMYSIYMFFIIHHGIMDFLSLYFYNMKFISILTLLIHWVPLNMMFLYLNYI